MHSRQSLGGPDSDAPEIPFAVIEEVSKWDFDTTSLFKWVKSALSYAGDSETSVEVLANALAAISKANFTTNNRALRMGLTRMSTDALGNNIISSGDATNPGDWIAVITAARVSSVLRKQASSSILEGLSRSRSGL